MTSREAYNLFQSEYNSVARANGVDVGLGRFVELYNVQQDIWFRNYTALIRGNKSAVDELQTFLVIDKELDNLQTLENSVTFDLPNNFFSLVGDKADVEAHKLGCRECYRSITCHITEAAKLKDLLKDKHSQPSFEFSETLGTLTEGKLKVYVDDTFAIKRGFINYYRTLEKIELAGYIKPNGVTTTVDINPELEDRFVKAVISLCVAEARQNNNQ